MTIKDFKHKLNIQLRYKDIDKQGHVNNAVHLTFFEVARVQYFKDVLSTTNNWSVNGIILARNEINYVEPIFLDDTVLCYTKSTSFGSKSFEITHIITKQINNTERICAEGKSTLVCFNYENNKTMEVPQEWKHAVLKYEGSLG